MSVRSQRVFQAQLELERFQALQTEFLARAFCATSMVAAALQLATWVG